MFGMWIGHQNALQAQSLVPAFFTLFYLAVMMNGLVWQATYHMQVWHCYNTMRRGEVIVHGFTMITSA
jgi:hypothetical protein